MTTTTLLVKGMSCGNCIRHVESALKKVTGVGSVTVDLTSGEAMVEYDPLTATIDDLKKAVEAAGYEANAA